MEASRAALSLETKGRAAACSDSRDPHSGQGQGGQRGAHRAQKGFTSPCPRPTPSKPCRAGQKDSGNRVPGPASRPPGASCLWPGSLSQTLSEGAAQGPPLPEPGEGVGRRVCRASQPQQRQQPAPGGKGETRCPNVRASSRKAWTITVGPWATAVTTWVVKCGHFQRGLLSAGVQSFLQGPGEPPCHSGCALHGGTTPK